MAWLHKGAPFLIGALLVIVAFMVTLTLPGKRSYLIGCRLTNTATCTVCTPSHRFCVIADRIHHLVPGHESIEMDVKGVPLSHSPHMSPLSEHDVDD